MPHKQQSMWMIIVVMCELVYLVYFYSLELPNAPLTDAWGTRISRATVCLVSIPGLFPDSPSLIGRAIHELQQVGNLLQRIPVLAYATLILMAVGGVGDAVLRIANLVLRRRDRPSAVGSWNEPVEHAVFAFGLGSSALSLGMLGLGLIGWMSRVVILVLLTSAATWCFAIAVRAIRRWCCSPDSETHSKTAGEGFWTRARRNPAVAGGVLASGLFLLISLLGAMLPATDFDVLEYHLQGPKEYYLAGRISFAPHNVYMNMPSGTEMLSLLSMVVVGDWWWGGLVGQTVLACFAPITALGIALLGRRCFGATAGWLGAFLYFTTPWVYRIAVIPHTESALAFYLLAATLAARRAVDEREGRLWFGNWLLVGLLAGSAAACKYTALISTVAPIGVGAVVLGSVFKGTDGPCRTDSFQGRPRARRRPWKAIVLAVRESLVARLRWGPAAVVLGVLLAVGPWLVRNAAWTANPTYPLLYNLFGGRNWTEEKNAKWEWGHRVALLVALGIQHPPPGMTYDPQDAQHAISLRQLAANLHDVTVQSDWLSPLLFSLAPLALAGPRGRRSARWLWLLVGFLFFQWWLLTNRYDRFWVPMLPIVAVLAGGGGVWCDRAVWRIFLTLIIPTVVWFNLSFCTTTLCGYNLYGLKLIPRTHPYDQSQQWLSNHLAPSARLLAVGEAAFFHLDRSVIYNTVFDDCWFAEWSHQRTPTQVAVELQRRGITHVFVNWSAIHRHRSAGGYGYSAQVTPGRFQELVANGVLIRVPIEAADLALPLSLDGHEVAPREVYTVAGTLPFSE